jgi:hypothetical protein
MMQRSKRLLLANMALIVVLVAGMTWIYDDWLTYGLTHQVSSVQPQPEPAPARLPSVQVPESIDEWSDVAVYNPFSFDRSDASASRPESEAPRGPVPVLYGTLAIGSDKTAVFVSAAAPDRRAYRPTKIGQTIDGWTLVEVDNKSVVVEMNTVRQTIVMNDPATRGRRQSGRTTTTRNPNRPAASVVVAEEPAVSRTTAGSRQTMAPAEPDIPAGYREVITPFGRKLVKGPGR